MLVFAGLVTLSMLGAIAAMSNEAGGGGLLRTMAPPTEREPAAEGGTARSQPEPTEAAEPAGEGAASGAVVVAPAPAPHRMERWLEAIAWALLALVFLAALALLLLFEGVRQLRRVAVAAEARGTMTAAQHSSR